MLSDSTSTTSVTLNWIAPLVIDGHAATKQGYRVSWSSNNGDGEFNVTESSTSTVIAGLRPNTVYIISIAVMASDGRVGDESDYFIERTRK